MSADIGSMLNGLKKTRAEMSAKLNEKLERDAKNIETYVKAKLKEFEDSHGAMSAALRKSLAAYVNDLASGVKKLLREHHTDMTQAGNFWKTTLAGSKARTAVPSIEITGKVTTVREAIGKGGPQAKGPHQDDDIEERVLGYINDRHDGVKVGDMEPALGVPKLRLGVTAKKLLDQGRIRKEGGLYYPV